MRDLRVKLKAAKEFVGFNGENVAWKALFPNKKSGDCYHNVYSASEIRNAKLQLQNIDPALLEISEAIPPIINCRMAKGGVGKTTICGGVASALAMLGYKVLMIDGDPQASLTGYYSYWFFDANAFKKREIRYSLSSFSFVRRSHVRSDRIRYFIGKYGFLVNGSNK